VTLAKHGIAKLEQSIMLKTIQPTKHKSFFITDFIHVNKNALKYLII